MALFVISHFIQVWLFPPGINLLLAATAWLLWRHHRLLAKTAIVLAFASLWLLSTPKFALDLNDTLQQQYPLLQVQSLPHSPANSAIVVLGGGKSYAEEYHSDILSKDSMNRVHYGAYLYQYLSIPIIVSGGKLKHDSSSIAALMAQALKDNFGINDIITEDKSITTADESKLIAPILLQHRIKTIYLVTSAWHMPRSMYTFKKVLEPLGIKVIAAPMGYFNAKSTDLPWLNYLPSLEGLYISKNAMHEYIGLLWYRFR